MSANEQRKLFSKSPLGWKIALATAIALSTGLISFYSFYRLRPDIETNSPPPQNTKARVAITALGRIAPQDDVIKLSAPGSLSGVRVQNLLVKEGDEVKEGELIALLEGYGKATAALSQAKDKVKIAQAKLAQVKAGAKAGDIDAQRAAIARIESQQKGEVAAQEAAIARLQNELKNAQTEYNRYQQLSQEGAIAATTLDSKRLTLQSVQQQLAEAQANLTRTIDTLANQRQEASATLSSIQQVRPQDIQLAEAELKSAVSGVKQATEEQRLTYVTTPISGTVLKVNARPGEIVATDGIVEIGQISQMNVVAEVYQTDVQQVRLGQKAVITSTAFPGKLPGTVTEIGLLIDKQDILSINPGADTDRRIVEVTIRIDNPQDSQRVRGLTNLQVDVAILI